MDLDAIPTPGRHLTIVMPIYNDWASFFHLVRDLDKSLTGFAARVVILGIDDGSPEHCPDKLPPTEFRVVERINVIKLAINLGHQGAIAIGLVETIKHLPDCVVVMDADGEDPPEGVKQLLQLHEHHLNEI